MSQIAKAKAEKEAEQARLKAEAEAKAAEATGNKMEPVEPQQEEVNIPITAELVEEPSNQPKQWIKFQAYMDMDQAKALGQYMRDHGIQYKAV